MEDIKLLLIMLVILTLAYGAYLLGKMKSRRTTPESEDYPQEDFRNFPLPSPVTTEDLVGSVWMSKSSNPFIKDPYIIKILEIQSGTDDRRYIKYIRYSLERMCWRDIESTDLLSWIEEIYTIKTVEEYERAYNSDSK